MAGNIYVGEQNKDPQNFPQAAFFDEAGSIPAPQPIRTNSAGFPCDSSGNPQRIYTSGPYSLRISDSNGVQVIYTRDSTDGFFGVTASDLSNDVDPAKGAGLVGFIIEAGATGTTVHDRLSRGWVDVKDYGAIGDGTANDKAAFDSASSTGRAILLPAGSYNVPSGDYSAARFYSFDGATTNNGTIAIVDPLSNSVPVGMETTFSCNEDGLPFGWLARNGQVLNRIVYAQLWAFAEGSGNIVDEVDKPSNPLAFGRGDGSTTFSLPDARGTVQGYADDGSGVDSSYVLGQRILKQSGAGTDTSISVAVSTPAIRAFGRAVDGGSINIQDLANQVNDLQTERLTKRTAVITTSGTFNDELGIPSWAKVVKVYLNAVSTNGSSNFIIQLGSGTPETTGYNSTASNGNAAAVATNGLLVASNISAATNYTGGIELVNVSGNLWIATGTTGGTGQAFVGSILSGNKTLSGVLSSIRLTTVAGTDVFDGGSFFVTCEGANEA